MLSDNVSAVMIDSSGMDLTDLIDRRDESTEY